MALRVSRDKSSVFLVSSVISHTYQPHCLKLYPGPRADLLNFNCELYDSHPHFSTQPETSFMFPPCYHDYSCTITEAHGNFLESKVSL